MRIKCPPLLVLVSTFASLARTPSSTLSHHHPSRRLHLAIMSPLLSHPHCHCCHSSSGSSSSSGRCRRCCGDDRAQGTSSPDWEDRMLPPFLQLLPPLVNGRSAAAAAVLLPPAPPACFYSGATSPMYQSLMKKCRAGLSAMTYASSLDRHDDNVEAQHRRHQPPRHLPRQQQ
jgi:hypothetical protein